MVLHFQGIFNFYYFCTTIQRYSFLRHSLSSFLRHSLSSFDLFSPSLCYGWCELQMTMWKTWDQSELIPDMPQQNELWNTCELWMWSPLFYWNSLLKNYFQVSGKKLKNWLHYKPDVFSKKLFSKEEIIFLSWPDWLKKGFQLFEVHAPALQGFNPLDTQSVLFRFDCTGSSFGEINLKMF